MVPEITLYGMILVSLFIREIWDLVKGVQDDNSYDFVSILLHFKFYFIRYRYISRTEKYRGNLGVVVSFTFIPVAGFIIYLIFGQKLSRRRIFYWKDQEKKLG